MVTKSDPLTDAEVDDGGLSYCADSRHWRTRSRLVNLLRIAAGACHRYIVAGQKGCSGDSARLRDYWLLLR